MQESEAKLKKVETAKMRITMIDRSGLEPSQIWGIFDSIKDAEKYTEEFPSIKHYTLHQSDTGKLIKISDECKSNINL